MIKPKILAWGNKVSAQFREILYQGCEAMRWKPESGPSDLMSCMAFESAESFNPGIKNMAGSSGTGLIQFMSFTAKSLGTTTEALARMTAEEQLRWVFKYFDQYEKLKNPNINLSDMYMGILLPSYIGKPENSILFTNGTIEYRQNSALDKNTDGKITKAEAAAMVYAKREKGFKDPFVFYEK